jgi:hypothetical protein
MPVSEYIFQLSSGSCSGSFWRGSPLTGSGPSGNTRDWPKNGAGVKGFVHHVPSKGQVISVFECFISFIRFFFILLCLRFYLSLAGQLYHRPCPPPASSIQLHVLPIKFPRRSLTPNIMWLVFTRASHCSRRSGSR